MIRQEIEQRGLPSHTQTKRDYLIPLGFAGASMELAGGMLRFTFSSPSREGVHIFSGVVDGMTDAIPVQGAVDASIDLAANTTAEMASEVTRKHIIEIGGEIMLERSMPATGRSKIWKQKLSTSRSVSTLCTTLSVPEMLPPAASVASSPAIDGGECPPLAIEVPDLDLPEGARLRWKAAREDCA